MKFLFNAAAEIQRRKDAHRQVKTALEYINPDKIASLQDLDLCFYNADNMPRGWIGRRHKDLKSSTLKEIYRQIDSGMPIFVLPATLANTHTASSIERAYGPDDKELSAIEKTLSSIENPDQKTKDLLCEVQQFRAAIAPDRLALMYVGHYLGALDEAEDFSRMTKIDAWLHGGNQTLQIIKDLQQVPDYSHRFPQRPPRNGKPSQEQHDLHGHNMPEAWQHGLR